MNKNKSTSIVKKKDSLENSLSFKNKKEEIRILTDLVNYEYVESIKNSLSIRRISSSTIASDIGVSKSYVSQVLNGNRHLNLSFITRLRRQYAIPLELIDTSIFNSVFSTVFSSEQPQETEDADYTEIKGTIISFTT